MKTLFFSSIFFLICNNLVGQSSVYISTNKATDDINQMIKTFDEVHYNPYFKTTKEEFNLIKEQFLSTWEKDSVTLKKFMVTGMKLAAIMSGGHSSLYWKNEQIIPEIKAYQYIPFTGKMIDQNHFLVTRSSHSEINEGAHIKSINGISIVDLYMESSSYIGGIEAFQNASCEKIFPLYLFFNEALKPPYTIEIENSDSNVVTDGLNINEFLTFINSKQRKEDYTFKILDDNIGLISYNRCNNYKKFKKFLKNTFKTIEEKSINKLIIDIRENGGGDSGLNDLLLSYITQTPYQQASGRYWKVSEQAKKTYSENKVYNRLFGEEFMNEYMSTPNQEVIEAFDTALLSPVTPENYFVGKSCILIGPSTFSSANFLADAVKTYKITTLIGSPTGEYTNDFGELLNFTLINSGCLVYISSTYDIGANGNHSILEPVYPDIEIDTDALKYAIDWIK